MNVFSKLYIAVIALAGITLSSCGDDPVLPPAVTPEIPEGMEANTTIMELKQQNWKTDRNYVNTIGTTVNGEDIIICGRVISSDESGNIYKNFVIDDGTAALTIAVNAYDLYQTYKYGQMVYVNVTGLKIGGYNNLMQLGGEGTYNGAPSMTFADESVFTEHAYPVGMGNPAAVDTITVGMSEIIQAKNTSEGLMTWQSRLVRFDNVKFEDAGQPFALSSSTSRYIVDEKGNRLNVYNSAYADFKNELLPYGYGSVVGILSYYGTDWQLLLMGADGCIDFDGEAPDTPVVPGETVTSLNVNFEDNAIPADWTQAQVAGNKSWYVTSFSNNYYAAMTGYKGTAPFDQWLISPAVDMSKVTDKTLSFDSQVNGYGSTTTVFEVYVMSTADPSSATLTKLNPALPTAPASGYSEFKSSGKLDLSSFSGTVHIGFRYKATKDENYATWCVDNIKLNASGSDTPDTPDTPAEGAEFTLTTTMATTATQYLMVAANMAAMPIDASKTYGYLNQAQMTVNGNTITTDKANAWTITPASSGAYTIQSADGRYLYMTGNYNSFNVAADMPSDGGALWNITIGTDGAATIKNSLTGKTIQLDTTYNSFGAYSDSRGVLPSLYMLK